MTAETQSASHIRENFMVSFRLSAQIFSPVLRHRFRLAIALFGAAILLGCTALGLEDNSTHLAFAIGKGVEELRSSNLSELVVHYMPLGSLGETYQVTMRHSREVVRVDAFGNTLNQGGGYLTVTGVHHGGTNYHERFVFTPRDLKIVKTNAPTEVVLRKSGDRIDVVELR
jgi:hypothetical protein